MGRSLIQFMGLTYGTNYARISNIHLPFYLQKMVRQEVVEGFDYISTGLMLLTCFGNLISSLVLYVMIVAIILLLLFTQGSVCKEKNESK